MNRILEESGQGEHRGLRIGGAAPATDPSRVRQRLRAWLDELSLLDFVQIDLAGGAVEARLVGAFASAWAPGLDTTRLENVLSEQCGHDARHVEREVLAGLLLSPLALDFPTFEEFESAVRIRTNTAEVSATAALRFDVDQNRPEAYWEPIDTGSFVLREGCSLVQGLSAAVQPLPEDEPYGFGCYRASEYMMLLAIAQEAAYCHPELKQRLRDRSTRRPIESREFHDVLSATRFDPDTYAVIATRGHQHDTVIAAQLAPRSLRYLGMLGSRRKTALTAKQLRDWDVTDEQIARMHAPEIGRAHV